MLTDYDTAGLNMFKTAINVMDDYFGLLDTVEIRRIGATPQQIEKFNLPTRPDKIKGEQLQAVELDAFLPVDIQNIVEAAITDYVSLEDLNVNAELEQLQIDQYSDFMKNFTLSEDPISSMEDSTDPISSMEDSTDSISSMKDFILKDVLWFLSRPLAPAKDFLPMGWFLSRPLAPAKDFLPMD